MLKLHLPTYLKSTPHTLGAKPAAFSRSSSRTEVLKKTKKTKTYNRQRKEGGQREKDEDGTVRTIKTVRMIVTNHKEREVRKENRREERKED